MWRNRAPTAAVALLLLLSANVHASIVAGPIINPANGHKYYLLSQDSWTNSESTAIGLAGHLATVRSASENNWIFDAFASIAANSNADLWIGLNDPLTNDGSGASHAQNFIWSSGESAGFRNWGPGEPNNDPVWGGERYGAIITQGHGIVSPHDWNDENVNGSDRAGLGVIEVVPEPVAALLPALTVLTASRRTKRHRRVLRV